MYREFDLNMLFDLAVDFANDESSLNHEQLLGITDGKAVGTYVEHRFDDYLLENVSDVEIGNSACGIDIPDQRVQCDIKVTSIRQPQSSCPYRDSRQKIYGLGYNILLFVYDKEDTPPSCQLDFQNVTLIEAPRTADFTLTRMIREMLDAGANLEDLIGLFMDKMLPGDEITLQRLAQDVMETTPELGYLTISNALQWRLQYKRVIGLHNQVEGVLNYDR